jgi:Flp pilus assembly protein TadB
VSAIRVVRALAALGAVGMLACTSAGPVSAAPSAAAPERAVMILLDVNGSFFGSAATAERNAALGYLRALPSDVHAGLITFGPAWTVIDMPTTDRGPLATAIASAPWTTAASTGLPGALAAARRALGKASAARILVLSDGEDLAGSLPSVTVPVDVVTWRLEGDDHTATLRRLAASSGGHEVSPARVAQLAAAFPPVTASSPSPQASQTHPAHPAPAAAVPASAPWQLSAPLLGSVGALAVGIIVLVLATRGALRSGRRGRRLAGQVAQYGPARAPAAQGQEEAKDGKAASTVVALAAEILRTRGADRTLAEKLDLAGLTIKPPEFVVLGACVSVVLAAGLSLLIRMPLLGVPAGLLAGWLIMRLVLSIRTSRRRAAFSDQLPDVLQLIASSLQSGFSLAQALDAVVREGSQPAAAEFSRALAEARFGADLADALDGVATRMDSSDMRWTVMAIRIQRSVGGNLAEVLRNTIGTMRERAFLGRHVRALSAEGRLSAYILVALPIVLAGWLFYSSPSYMRLLYTTAYGLVMLGGAIALVVIGSVWMRALIKVEV